MQPTELPVLDVPVRFSQLALGGEISFDHRGETVRLKLSPATAVGQRFRLAEKGVVVRAVLRGVPLQPDEVVPAGPKWAEYLALPLFFPVGVYAMYIAFSTVQGDAALNDPRVISFGLIFGGVLAAWSLWSNLTRRYWRLDARGLTQGRLSGVHLPWAEIEGAVLGMPKKKSLLWQVASAVDEGLAAQHQGRQALRAGSVVLRLSGDRLFQILPAEYREALIYRLLDALGERIAWPESYSPSELAAFDRWKDGKINAVS